ncbi:MULTISPECIES: dihydropteroate synthase [Thermotoga]|uniref:dihydropteroate synthase n=1 Tax=Thermotoga maritima (strain ATCC 43589 / DSM 3109 / JCM 10099 / NBRC 100826 / MSB8) TaxID=243274 RepID=Q9WXP7_THEMA|nr:MULTISPECIES: dihydropteroate synthase [Thermotoga]AAD35134.1 dihydropteroate synthase [Thermotoga maritima MSB8]ACB09256.1 dihydropteroate synthase [Thermotoga sp. RQ2]AGL48963.1 Dihydropteroate synthase [Thermotoga maritima MSB8]AHD18189.1 dihydropteroate synthase [Thermotoga maritima MSB8]AIY88218.1 dihydropteroate synthase [Thermotoga sp. Cell2]
MVYTTPWNRKIEFGRTMVMGIINVTPDSFFADSRKQSVLEAVETAKKMIEEGADIIDVGGMSTRPGSDPVDEEEELNRVIPVIRAIRSITDVPISVDTYRWRVALKALEAGADIVNDISGYQFEPDIVRVVSENNVPYVLMHIKGTPKTMQENPHYEDVVKEIKEYFTEKIEYLKEKGVNQIVLDPGIGFGKRYEDNLEILRRIDEFKELKLPILIGASRKSFIGITLGNVPPEERLEGTLAVTAYCTMKGVDIIRVHDVLPNKRVIRMMEAILWQRL